MTRRVDYAVQSAPRELLQRVRRQARPALDRFELLGYRGVCWGGASMWPVDRGVYLNVVQPLGGL